MQTDNLKKTFKSFLLNISFQPSYERLAKHSLKMHPYYAIFYEIPDDDIIAAVRRSAFLTEDGKITLWKSREKKILKLTSEHLSVAESVKKAGFNVGPWPFPSYSIEHCKYIPILQCMKCFEYETHPTKNCKSKKDICSECSKENHTYGNCPNPNLAKCVNCLKMGNENPNHITMWNSCPEKKKILKRKRDEKKEKD